MAKAKIDIEKLKKDLVIVRENAEELEKEKKIIRERLERDQQILRDKRDQDFEKLEYHYSPSSILDLSRDYGVSQQSIYRLMKLNDL